MDLGSNFTVSYKTSVVIDLHADSGILLRKMKK